FTRNLLELIGRQALHAETLRFRQPTTGKPLAFTAPLPEDMKLVLEKIRTVMTASQS
ncbi:MAG TPA: RNA pseudouridine synthase, partial [Chlorobaculum parvum]|nr:RNA pseudouridine synthase [Chlorobaculum parvum]